MVPALINSLETNIPELATFGGDLRTFHNLRDTGYHMGQSMDEYNLNWGLERVESFFKAVEESDPDDASNNIMRDD